jgi:hypothetical protein
LPTIQTGSVELTVVGQLADTAGGAWGRGSNNVDMVVKEMLADCTVIQDMSLSGNVLSRLPVPNCCLAFSF